MMLELPIDDCDVNPDIAAELFRLKPLVPKDLVMLGFQLSIEQEPFEQIYSASRFFHSFNRPLP